MNERLRQEYLEALGVTSFTPRFLLVGAKAPTRCRLPVARPEFQLAQPSSRIVATAGPSVQHPSPVPPSGPAQIAPSRPAAIAGPALDERPKLISDQPSLDSTQTFARPSRISAQPLVDDLVDQKGVGDKGYASFSLGLWRVSEAIYCIDSRRPGDALPTEKLLSNILTGLGLLKTALPAVEVLNWPLVPTNPDKSWDAARNMVQGFLDGKLFSAPVKYFFLFGSDAVAAVMGDELDYPAQLFTCHSKKILAAEVMILPSLADILYQPACKLPLWNALKNIRPL